MFPASSGQPRRSAHRPQLRKGKPPRRAAELRTRPHTDASDLPRAPAPHPSNSPGPSDRSINRPRAREGQSLYFFTRLPSRLFRLFPRDGEPRRRRQQEEKRLRSRPHVLGFVPALSPQPESRRISGANPSPMQEADRPGGRARGGGGAAAKMTAPRGGGDEPPPPSSASAGNEPVTPTSAYVSAGLNRRGSRGAVATFSMEVFDNEVVPSTLSSIAPILRVAAEIEPERPRVAYLCTCIRVLGDYCGAPCIRMKF